MGHVGSAGHAHEPERATADGSDDPVDGCGYGQSQVMMTSCGPAPSSSWYLATLDAQSPTTRDARTKTEKTDDVFQPTHHWCPGLDQCSTASSAFHPGSCARCRETLKSQHRPSQWTPKYQLGEKAWQMYLTNCDSQSSVVRESRSERWRPSFWEGATVNFLAA